MCVYFKTRNKPSGKPSVNQYVRVVMNLFISFIYTMLFG